MIPKKIWTKKIFDKWMQAFMLDQKTFMNARNGGGNGGRL